MSGSQQVAMLSGKWRNITIIFVIVIVALIGSLGFFLLQQKQQTAQVEGTTTKFKVIKVVDGDTIDVADNQGMEYKVRLIGIDTPETVDPRKPVQCFGEEAKQKMYDLVMGKEVILQPDQSQADIDKYQRELRYVFLPDGTFINKKMIADGYAYEYTYDVPYQYQDDFKTAQRNAQDTGLGLWDAQTCAGHR